MVAFAIIGGTIMTVGLAAIWRYWPSILSIILDSIVVIGAGTMLAWGLPPMIGELRRRREIK